MHWLYQKALEDSLNTAVGDINPIQVASRLFDKGVVTKEDITLLQKTSSLEKCCKTFVYCLQQKCDESFSVLVETLENSPYHHNLSCRLRYNLKLLQEECATKGIINKSSIEEPFIFLSLMVEVAASLTPTDVQTLCKYFEFSEETTKQICDDRSPGAEFIKELHKKEVLQAKNATVLLTALTRNRVWKPAEILFQYTQIIVMPDIWITAKANKTTDQPVDDASVFSTILSDDKEMMFKTCCLLKTFFKEKCSLFFCGLEKANFTLILRVPSQESFTDLQEHIEKEDFLAEVLSILTKREDIGKVYANARFTCNEESYQNAWDLLIKVEKKKRNWNLPSLDDKLTMKVVLRYCRKIFHILTACPMKGAKSFDPDIIEGFKVIAAEVEERRLRKDYATIAGSSAGIIGGGLSIIGVALSPVTFGASLGLLISGIAIGLGGAGINIGFSLDKFIRDKQAISNVKDSLESFIQLVKTLFSLINVLHTIKVFVDDLEDAGLNEFIIKPERELKSAFINIANQVCALNSRMENENSSFEERLCAVHLYAKQLFYCLKKTVQRLQVIFTNDSGAWFDKFLEKSETSPLDSLVLATNDFNDEVEDQTVLAFISYVFRHGSNAEASLHDSSLPVCISSNAATKFCTQGGLVGSRMALRAVDATENIVQLGSNALKVAKGISAAGIVLSGLGIAVDVAFLGHAVYDLLKNDKDKLAEALCQVANAMEDLNNLV